MIIKGEYGNEIKLLLDCQTRRKSLLTIVERFLKLRKSIEKALRIVGSTDTLSDSEWNTLQSLVNNFGTIEIVLEKSLF